MSFHNHTHYPIKVIQFPIKFTQFLLRMYRAFIARYDCAHVCLSREGSKGIIACMRVLQLERTIGLSQPHQSQQSTASTLLGEEISAIRQQNTHIWHCLAKTFPYRRLLMHGACLHGTGHGHCHGHGERG